MNFSSFSRPFLTLLFLFCVAVVFSQTFSDGIIKVHLVKQSYADSVQISVIVEQQKINGFAKLQGELPQSVTVSDPHLPNTAFNVVENNFKLIWINTPPAFSFQVPLNFKMNSNEMVSMTYSYLLDKEVRRIEMKNIRLDRNNDVRLSLDSLLALGEGVKVKPIEKVVREMEPLNLKNKKNFEPKFIIQPDVPIRSSSEVVFKVQIAASKRRLSENKIHRLYPNGKFIVSEELHNDGYYKLTIGNFDTYEDAHKLKLTCGVKGAFIVAQRNGRLMNIVEAIKLQEPAKQVNLIYTVQFVALSAFQSNSKIREEYPVPEIINLYEHKGLYTYSIGQFRSYASAVAFQKQLPFPDLYIVPYRAGERISIKEARLLE